MKYCGYCGAVNENEDGFCNKCGKPFPKEESITTEVAESKTIVFDSSDIPKMQVVKSPAVSQQTSSSVQNTPSYSPPPQNMQYPPQAPQNSYMNAPQNIQQPAQIPPQNVQQQPYQVAPQQFQTPSEPKKKSRKTTVIIVIAILAAIILAADIVIASLINNGKLDSLFEKDSTVSAEDGAHDKKTASPYACGETFSDSPSPREVYFPFGGTYNLFTL